MEQGGINLHLINLPSDAPTSILYLPRQVLEAIVARGHDVRGSSRIERIVNFLHSYAATQSSLGPGHYYHLLANDSSPLRVLLERSSRRGQDFLCFSNNSPLVDRVPGARTELSEGAASVLAQSPSAEGASDLGLPLGEGAIGGPVAQSSVEGATSQIRGSHNILVGDGQRVLTTPVNQLLNEAQGQALPVVDEVLLNEQVGVLAQTADIIAHLSINHITETQILIDRINVFLASR